MPVALKNLDKYGVDATPVRADLQSLPFDSKSFDVVISLSVMEHIPDPTAAHCEMYRVLKSGGLTVSMNVPENSNIQRVAKPVNTLPSKAGALSAYRHGFLKRLPPAFW